MQRLQNALTKQLTDEHERIDLKLREKEESKVEEVKVQQLKYDFTTQTLFKEKAIEDLKGVIMLP